jgi:hypothetical protein
MRQTANRELKMEINISLWLLYRKEINGKLHGTFVEIICFLCYRTLITINQPYNYGNDIDEYPPTLERSNFRNPRSTDLGTGATRNKKNDFEDVAPNGTKHII